MGVHKTITKGERRVRSCCSNKRKTRRTRTGSPTLWRSCSRRSSRTRSRSRRPPPSTWPSSAKPNKILKKRRKGQRSARPTLPSIELDICGIFNSSQDLEGHPKESRSFGREICTERMLVVFQKTQFSFGKYVNPVFCNFSPILIFEEDKLPCRFISQLVHLQS